MAITLEGTTYTDGTTTWSPNRDGAYEIGSLDQLKFFRDAVNDGNTFAGQRVLLTASIDLNNEEWTPIGKSGKTFQGTFDGQGNTVSNLYINTPTQSDVGFFGFTTDGEIKNLTIENANVTGYLDVGAVAGTPYTSKYTNITLKGEVKVQGFAYVGGMFGKNVYANLTNLTIDAAEGSYVTADSGAYRTYVGGVIGFMGESESNSIVVKNVTSNINVSGSTCDIGGITGIAHYGNSFINVTCTAKEVVLVNAADEGDQYEVGGIAGVWNNEPERIVQFINCSVENTEIKSSLNGVEQDVSANTMSGNAYVRDDTGTGSLLIGQNVVIEEDGKYSAGEFTVSGPNAVNVLNGKLADGLTVYPSADGTLEVDVTGYVAAIGDTRYTTAKEALTVANELRGTTIDLMEGTYSYVAPTTSSDVKITNAGTYNIINGDGVLLNYDLDVNPDLADGEYILSMTNANLTLTKLTLRSNSSLTVTDSRIDYNAYEGGSAYLSVYNNSVLNVSNSTIGFDPHQSGVDDPSLLPAAGTGAMDPYWNWAPTWNIYGTATIENSTLFAYVGQGNQAGFDVRGNGTATVIGSELSAALVNVGTDYDSAKLEPGADENNLSATLIFDSTTVKNTQYRGDYNTNNGIDIGQADGSTAGKLVISNKSDVDFTILNYGDTRQIGLRVNNAKSSVEISDSTVKLPSVTNSGSITLGSASKLLADSVTNAGTISLDYTSTLAFEDIANSGTITIDMDGFSGGLYKLLDYTGSDSYTLEQYKTLIGEENWDENFTVVNNDLFAADVDMTTLKVNAEWSGLDIGEQVADGYYYGFNAFGDMNTAVSSIDRSYVLGDTFSEPITIEMTDATSGTLNLYGMNLVLTGNLTSSGSWNLALVPVASSGTDPNYITYLKLDKAQIEMTGGAALEGVNYGKAAVSFEKDGNIIASADQNIQRGAIVELVNGTVFDADNQVNGRGVFFKIDGASRITQYGTGNSLITMTSGAIVDGGQSTAGDYTSINQLDANDIYFGRGSSQWAGIYGDKTYFTFRKGANVEAKDCIEFGTGSHLKEMDVEINASRIVAINNMIIGTENNAGKITSFVVSNNSLLQAGTDLSIVGTTVELSNSTLNAATVTLTDGKLNVSGTSAITAEVSGDLDIVDGAAVTFGAGSTSDDLRIASGAEVTLRGSLSSGNIYGVDEKGTHEYNDGSNGITVNVATGDGETFKSYAWYASNGSTYNVMAGSNVELTYANINATGTVNVAEGATLTTVMESSNIVGTLNVDGTANGVMTVYAGYTDGQFTNGAQAGEVNINGTGTVNTSIMTIGTAVRDDDKYNAAAVEGSNTTASVVVDGGTLNAIGFEGELTSKLFVGSDDFEGVLTGKNGAKINVGERSANGTGYMRFVIGKQGTLSLAGSTLTVYNLGGTNNSVNGIFENSGTISMDLASQIITATVLNNNYGTITVDMSDATEFGVYKLVDYTGTSEVTGYGNVTLSNSAYETVVIDGDLFAADVDMTTLKVNSAWSGSDIGTEVEEGFYYGFNAFDNLDKVYSTIAAGGVSKIELQSDVQLENGNPPVSDMWFKFQDDVTIDSNVAGEVRTIQLSGHELLLTSMDQSRDNGGKKVSITLGKDINILTDSAIWFGYCYNDADAYPQYAGNFAADITLNGNVTMTSGQAHIFGHGSTMTINETGSLTVAGSDIQTRGSHLIVNGTGKDMAQAQVQLNHENIEGDSPLIISGDDPEESPAEASWTLNNTFVNINTYLGINTATGSRASGIDAALNMNNSRLNVGQDLTMADAATVLLDNQSELNIGGNIKLGFEQEINEGSSITVENSSQLVATNLLIDAETSVSIGKNSEVMINEGVTNAGTISLDYTSTLAFGDITNNGTITIDTEEFSSGIYRILDYTGADTYTEDQYKALLGNIWNDKYRVENNDLYLTNLDGSEVRYVNSAWKGSADYDEVTFVDGTRAYYGQNAFDTVGNALSDTSYNEAILLNVTGDIEAITVVGKDVTEVNASAKSAIFIEDSVIDTDAIVVNLVDINNTNAGWQVYYALESGCDAKVYGNITTNFLSSTFTAGSQTGDPNFSGAGYAGTTATVYGNTTVNIGEVDADDSKLTLNTSFLLGAGGGTVNGDSSLNINSGIIEVDAIAGGGAWRGQVKGDSNVTISGGVVSVDTDPESTGRAIFGGSYGNIGYDPDAPGAPAATGGNASVIIKGDADVTGKIIGGSEASNVKNSLVDISGTATVTGNVFGGGNRGGQVEETSTVNLADSATVNGNVYGGGFGTADKDSSVATAAVTISGGTVSGNVYAGGSNSSVAGDAVVTLTGGTVGGDVYGGSEGSGTVTGSSTLNIGAADAALYTSGLNNVYDFDVATVVNADVTVDGVFSAAQINIADATLTLNSGFDAATTKVSIEVDAYNAASAALVLGSAAGTAPAISISGDVNALTEARYLIATGFDDTTAFSLEESLAADYLLRTVDGNVYLYDADAPYFTTELSVTQAAGPSVNGSYSFTAGFAAEGLLLSGYTLKLYDSAGATTLIDEVTLDAAATGYEFTLANTVQNFWISVTANSENGLSSNSPTSGLLEVAVKDYDSPVLVSLSADAATGSVTLSSEATDNFGVTGYEFFLDGQSLGVQSDSTYQVDGSTLSGGTHSYSVKVYDAAGNVAASAEQTFEFTPEPEPTLPATFLYSSQIPVNNGESMTVYANYSDPSVALEYRIGESGEWLAYDAAAGVNVTSSTTIYFREQGISAPVETEVDVRIVPVEEEVKSEIIQLAPTTDTIYEATYNFTDGTSKTVELSGNTVEHYALPEETTITIVEKDETGTVVNTIVEETPVAVTTSTVPDMVVAVDDGHDNIFFAMSIGKWGSNYMAQHHGDGVWSGTREMVSMNGKNRFSTVFTGGSDATILFLTDDAKGDAFFLDDVYTANGADARISKMTEIHAGAGDDVVDLTSERFSYEEHVSGQLIVRGGDGNDVLWGNAGKNIMFGDAGNDKITGGSGNDILIGGDGNDTLHGGGGDDIFCYGSDYDWGKDTITQLSTGSVTLYMDGVDMNDCKISGNKLTWSDGIHSGTLTLKGVSWDSVKFFCAANGTGDLSQVADYNDLKKNGAFAAVSSH